MSPQLANIGSVFFFAPDKNGNITMEKSTFFGHLSPFAGIKLYGGYGVNPDERNSAMISEQQREAKSPHVQSGVVEGVLMSSRYSSSNSESRVCWPRRALFLSFL